MVKLNGLFKNKFPNYIYYVLPVITYYTITITTYLHNKNLQYTLFSNDSTCVFQLRIFVLKIDFPNLHKYLRRSGIPTWFSGTWNQPKNEFIRQIEQGVSSFFRILTYVVDEYPNFLQTFFVLLCEKSSDMA